MKKVFLIISLVLMTGVFLQAQVNVTFQADMRVAIATGYFDPATETLTCPGDFDNWLNEPPANTDKVLTDDDNDSVYTITIAMDPNATYGYKFNIGLGWDGKDEFQGMDNRSLVLGASDTTLNPVFYNNYTPYSGSMAEVTFNVDMRGPAKSNFDPSTGHVYVAGNFTNWGTDAVEMTDADGDSVYTATDTLNSGDLAIYKFIHSTSDAASGTWESPTEGDDIFDDGSGNINRIVGITDTGNVVNRFWNNTDPNVTTGNGNIFFEVDMSVANELGVFNPDVDSVQIRGSFNGWNASDPPRSLMNQNPADPNDWYLDVSFTNWTLNSLEHYKYFIQSDTSGGRTPFANTGWEVAIAKTDAGNRDRPVTFMGSDTQEQPLQYFGAIKPDWVIPAGTTVEWNFSVDMTYATLADTQGTNPVFNPATDTVFLIPQQPFYYAVNGLPWSSLPYRALELTDDNDDMIYTGTLTIDGPMFNGLLYVYAYSSTSGLISESGSQNDMRVRFIGQTGPRAFVSPYSSPQDVWSNSPKPEEDGPVLSVRDLPGVPNVYSLDQNYPNPFNPETMIRFSIPEQGLVTLKVYNLLGEEVTTLINKEMTSGSYEVDFNGTNLSSGIYLYTITANNYVATKKMILLK